MIKLRIIHFDRKLSDIFMPYIIDLQVPKSTIWFLKSALTIDSDQKSSRFFF